MKKLLHWAELVLVRGTIVCLLALVTGACALLGGGMIYDAWMSDTVFNSAIGRLAGTLLGGWSLSVGVWSAVMMILVARYGVDG